MEIFAGFPGEPVTRRLIPRSQGSGDRYRAEYFSNFQTGARYYEDEITGFELVSGGIFLSCV